MRLAFSVLCLVSAISCYATEPAALLKVNQTGYLTQGQKLAVIPEARLQEILSKLSSNFEPAQLRHFLPRCWHPDEFFAPAKHQNLWNKTGVQIN